MSKLLEVTILKNAAPMTLQYQVNEKRRNVIVASAYLPFNSWCILTIPWWNQDLRKLKKSTRRFLYRKSHKNEDQLSFENFKLEYMPSETLLENWMELSLQNWVSTDYLGRKSSGSTSGRSERKRDGVFPNLSKWKCFKMDWNTEPRKKRQLIYWSLSTLK